MKNDETKQKIRGIRIKNFNIIMMMITCIVYAFILVTTVHITQKYNQLESSMEKYTSGVDLAQQLREGSDYLTEQVRLYAETGEVEYAQNYFTEINETRRRDEALEEFSKMDLDADSESELTQALERSNELTQTEYYAMRLTAEAYGTKLSLLPDEIQSLSISGEDRELSQEEMEKKARDLVFNEDYIQSKSDIYEHLNQVIHTTTQWKENHMTEVKDELSLYLNRQRFLISVLFFINLSVFFFLFLLVIRPLRIYIKSIQDNTLFDIVGAYEFKYLALTYNNIFEINTENKEKIRYSLEHDKLTGILNRNAYDSLTQYLQKSEIPIAMLVLDIDHFKQINDSYGHDMGDRILKNTAELLHRSFRNKDKVIRYGGDEFVVIMVDMTPENQHVIYNKISEINEILQNPVDDLPAITLSVGAAFSSKGFSKDLFKKADEALYIVKNGGRSGCTIAQNDA